MYLYIITTPKISKQSDILYMYAHCWKRQYVLCLQSIHIGQPQFSEV